jgi:pyrroloquinoline-quinone synthase
VIPLRQKLDPDAFTERLRREGSARYHHAHPFHIRMHQGTLSRYQLQQWVINRYYYQTRIPIKDALILAKSEDPAFRRAWIRRIHDHDGHGDEPGGLALWRRLALGVGVGEKTLLTLEGVLPGVRFACDAYVSFVREATLVEAVASSLTELFAQELMATRIAAWERHYRWVDPQALEYFKCRVSRAPHDAQEALEFTLVHASTAELQNRCVAALIRKTEILWHVLDCLYAALITDVEPKHDHRAEPAAVVAESAPPV